MFNKKEFPFLTPQDAKEKGTLINK